MAHWTSKKGCQIALISRTAAIVADTLYQFFLYIVKIYEWLSIKKLRTIVLATIKWSACSWMFSILFAYPQLLVIVSLQIIVEETCMIIKVQTWSGAASKFIWRH